MHVCILYISAAVEALYGNAASVNLRIVEHMFNATCMHNQSPNQINSTCVLPESHPNMYVYVYVYTCTTCSESHTRTQSSSTNPTRRRILPFAPQSIARGFR